MSDKIPVTFTHKDKQYSGFLEQVQGAGSSVTYHLMIDGYYYGKLRIYNGQWVFDSNRGIEGIAEVLGEFVVVGWG